MQKAHIVIGDSDEEEALDKRRSEVHLLPAVGHGGGLGGQFYFFLCEQKKVLLKKQAANFSDIEEKLFKRFGGSMYSYSGTK